MSLIVTFWNISELADISDYLVGVFVNDKRLYAGEIHGHRRADGWQALVKQFAEGIKEDEQLDRQGTQ